MRALAWPLLWYPLAVTVGMFAMDDLKVQHVIFALFISSTGGLVAAILMTFENIWNAWGFIRLVMLGMLIGLPLAFVLDDKRAAFLGEGKVAVLFMAGFLAYPTFQALGKVGPVKIFWAIVTKFAGMKPAAVDPGGKDNGG